MDDIDRSVETFDFAMRRRFTWCEVTAAESAENMQLSDETKRKLSNLNDRFNAMKGIVLFPTKKEKNFYEDYTIIDTDGILKKIGLAIPQSVHTFSEFVKIMQQNEQDLLRNLFLF